MRTRQFGSVKDEYAGLRSFASFFVSLGREGAQCAYGVL